MVFVDMLIMLLVTIIAYALSATNRKINKLEGSILTMTYILYMVFIIIRK